jgi:hypothetical protein
MPGRHLILENCSRFTEAGTGRDWICVPNPYSNCSEVWVRNEFEPDSDIDSGGTEFFVSVPVPFQPN